MVQIFDSESPTFTLHSSTLKGSSHAFVPFSKLPIRPRIYLPLPYTSGVGDLYALPGHVLIRKYVLSLFLASRARARACAYEREGEGGERETQ